MEPRLHDRAFVAFVHIEKAAGTTFIHILRRNYFLRYLDVRPYSPASNSIFTARDLELSLRVNPWLHAFGGHSVRPIGDLCDTFPNIRFVTILREPARRYISQYLYGNAILKLDLSFEEFLADSRTHDFQTRKIAGSADAARAIHILRTRFLAVGLVENLSKFLATLTIRLRPERFHGAHEPRNVGSYSREEAELLDAHGAAIAEVNQVDDALYRHVQKMVNESPQLDGRQQIPMLGHRDRLKYFLDGALRKAYYEPVTGLMRVRNGLTMKGSY
ncbi:MAG: hypothetical protein WD793_09005 [Steroidobacteraceae bacterium]